MISSPSCGRRKLGNLRGNLCCCGASKGGNTAVPCVHWQSAGKKIHNEHMMKGGEIYHFVPLGIIYAFVPLDESNILKKIYWT